jgi:hypothetical protein
MLSLNNYFNDGNKDKDWLLVNNIFSYFSPHTGIIQ